MKLGILSDTHLHDLASATELAERLLRSHFKDVDAILHAGDAIMDELSRCFYPLPWYAVRGNMDRNSSPYPEKRILELADKKIGLIHGWGHPGGLEQRVITAFPNQLLDALVFGHSHQPCCRRVGEMLLFNPGSATDRRQAVSHTVGILILGSTITGEILTVE